MVYGDASDDSENGSAEERLSPIRDGSSTGEDASPSKKCRIDAQAFTYGSPVRKNKSQPTMDSPFLLAAGNVSFNGSSESPGSCYWTALSGARMPAQTPPPKVTHARMPSLFGDDRRVDLFPLRESGAAANGDKLEQQLEQAAVMAMHQISGSCSSRSPSSSSHGGSQPDHLATHSSAKATRRPPNASVYLEDDDQAAAKARNGGRQDGQQQLYDSTPGPMTPAAAIGCYAMDDASVISSNAAQRKRLRHARAPKPCNCKRSRCLKLYCECFAAGIYCKDCNCCECLNVVPASISPEEIAARAKARQESDGPDEFGYEDRVRHCDAGGSPLGADSQLRTGGLASSSSSSTSKRKQHAKRSEAGCSCKRSLCLKKYCECFEAGVFCDKSCRCISCHNTPGNPELALARQKLQKAEAKAAAAAASNGNASRVSPRPLVTPCGGSVDSPAVVGQRPVISGDILLETPVNHSKKSGIPKLTKKKPNAGGPDDLERLAREAWTDTMQRAVQRRTVKVDEARRDYHAISDHAAAAAAVVDAVESQQQLSSNSQEENEAVSAVEVALKMATAAAVKGTLASFAPNSTERNRELVARACASSTYDEVLNLYEREEKLASAAASWGHAAALAAQKARNEGKDEETVKRLVRERAREIADESEFSNIVKLRTPSPRPRAQRTTRQPLRDVGDLRTRAKSLERQAEVAKNKLNIVASSLERLRKKVHCPSHRSKCDKHTVHLRWLNERDGKFRAPGLPIHRPLVIKTFQCLSSEDLYGSCLVSREWTGLALDKALWAFFPNSGSNNNSLLSPERPIGHRQDVENDEGYSLNRRVSIA